MVEEDHVEEPRKAKEAKHEAKGGAPKGSPRSPRGNGAKDKGRVSPSKSEQYGGVAKRESPRVSPSKAEGRHKEVKEILEERLVKLKGLEPSRQYLVRWRGAAPSKVTWELESSLDHHHEALERYWEATTSTRTSTDSVGESVTPRQNSTLRVRNILEKAGRVRNNLEW
ncbi:hypothetical protein ACET3Z_019886 [Daucus carota]